MAKKKKKSNSNQFQKQDNPGLFSFDATRRDVLKWGLLAGGIGGLFMLRTEIVWQIVGVFAIVLISNHHINKASARIPRWHATVISFFGVLVSMFAVIIIGTIVLTYFAAGGSAG